MNFSSYLYFGYAPEHRAGAGFDFSFPEEFGEGGPYLLAPKAAACLLDDVLETALPPQFDRVIVPISGGWDSRILLGAAVERFGRDQVLSVSFGSPGLLDFDLGKLASEHLGVEHIAIDLAQHEVSWEGLLDSVKSSPWTYVPDGYYNQLAIRSCQGTRNSVVLSGFMGDPLTGGHPAVDISKSEAALLFVQTERREKALMLAPPGYDPIASLPELACPPNTKYSTALDIAVRQSWCIAPIVTPLTNWGRWRAEMGYFSDEGPRVIAPFADPRWAHYWLNAPDHAKRGQVLYRAMMAEKFPTLAKLPSKYSLGARTRIGYLSSAAQRKARGALHRWFPSLIQRPTETLNYLDFAAAFRDREDYRQVLEIAIDFLAERQVVPWLDLAQIKREHLERSANRENALLVLVGLALNLQASNSVVPVDKGPF